MRESNLGAAFAAALTVTCLGDVGDQVQKLTAPSPEHDGRFGRAVAMDGEYLVVGGNGGEDGAVFVYRAMGPEWVFETELVASDGDVGDGFGESVAIRGEYVVVGAAGDDDLGSSSGAAYVFRRTGSAWTEHAKLTASDGDGGDWFGFVVSISDHFLLVGAPMADGEIGAAYVFVRVAGSVWVEQAKLAASDGTTEDEFAAAVAINDGLAVVGANGADDFGMFTGAAYVFRRRGTMWMEEERLLASDANEFDAFGVSVAVQDTSIAIGARNGYAPSGMRTGSVYVFEHDESGWSEDTELNPSDAPEFGTFGESISFSGARLLVGTRSADAAYLFSHRGAAWTEQAVLTPKDGVDGDNFGRSVALGHTLALVGAHLHASAGEPRAGAAYLFDARLCTADVDVSGEVDVGDLLIVLAAWGTPTGDVTGDGTTDVADLLAVLSAWGPCE